METSVQDPETRERRQEVEQAKDHGRQRTIYRVGNSYVVPVPLWARQLIDRIDGGSVYWHESRPHEIVLTSEPKRAAGRPPGAAAERTIARLTRENLRLRRRLRARPLGVLGEQISQVMMQAIKVGLPIEATLDETRDLVRDIHARLPYRRNAGPRRSKRAAPDVETAPGPDTYAPRDAPSPVEPGDPPDAHQG